MESHPLCFVLMPFGRKKDPGGGPDIDFDAIYELAIRPGIEDAGMEPIRADEERTGGIIHKAMFERLLLCDFAVADLTTANANVFYELGVRHAARPATTLTIYAAQHAIPFDTNFLRSCPYDLGDKNGFGPTQARRLRFELGQRLRELRKLAHDVSATDSPLFQVLDGYQAPDIAHLKTDVFRDQAQYSTTIKRELARARENQAPDGLGEIEASLGALDSVETGVLVDLFLSYRAVRAWDRMIALYERLPLTLQRSVMLREQLGFAYNRAGRRQEAIGVLEEVIGEHGPSAEACGILGRVYKDLWGEARARDQHPIARGYLDRAASLYQQGFEADWRDAYPGINAVTLLDIKGDEESQRRKQAVLPVVRYAVMQRIKGSRPDYWDYATLLELAVLEEDEAAASRHLGDALAYVREPWEPATTANNLRLIGDARRERGMQQAWLEAIIEALQARSAP